MSKFQIEISRTAEKQLKKISKSYQQRVVSVIVQLGLNPYPFGHKKLSGYEDLYRVRIGDYRVIYSVENKKLIIIVIPKSNFR